MHTRDEGIGMRNDLVHAHGCKVTQRGIQGIQRGKAGHAHGEAERTGLDAGAFKAVGVERICDVVPATGARGEPRGGFLWNADDAAAMDAEGPFVRAGDDDVSLLAVQRDAAQRLRDIDGDDRLRRVLADHVAQRRKRDAVAVVEAHEADLHESGALVEQFCEIDEVQSASAIFPQPRDRARCLRRGEPGRGSGGEIEIGDDDFVLRRQLQRVGQQVVGFGATGAEGDFIGAEAEVPGCDLAAGFDTRKMKVSPAHAECFVLHVLRHGLIHTERRDAFGGGVEIMNALEAGEIGGAGGVGEHTGKKRRSRELFHAQFSCFNEGAFSGSLSVGSPLR